jgi:hypothetical protein
MLFFKFKSNLNELNGNIRFSVFCPIRGGIRGLDVQYIFNLAFNIKINLNLAILYFSITKNLIW